MVLNYYILFYSLILFKEIKIIIRRQIRQIHDRVMDLTDLTADDNITSLWSTVILLNKETNKYVSQIKT